MIIPIYSDDLFELITLASVDQKFLQTDFVYQMAPEYSSADMGLPLDVDTNPIFAQDIPIIQVRLQEFKRRAPGWREISGPIQSTWLGFALCDDELALRIRAAFAPGQRTSLERRYEVVPTWRLR